MQAKNKNIKKNKITQAFEESKKEKVDCTKPLKDTWGDGKAKDWRGKKLLSQKLVKSYKRLAEKNKIRAEKKYYLSKAARVTNCTDKIYFKGTAESKRLYKASFCRIRLCPICMWRRSLKVFGQVSKIMTQIEEYYDYRYLFLTLTVKNVSGKDLDSTTTALLKAFQRMIDYKEISNTVHGWFRALEVTHKFKQGDFHPHIHAVLAVSPTYFQPQSFQYITQARWTEYWQKALNSIGYDFGKHTVVNIKKVKNKTSEKSKKPGYSKVIAEISKYTVKSVDYLHPSDNNKKYQDYTDNAVVVLDKALHKRRLIAFGGRFKKIHAALNLDDPTEGNLVITDNEELRDDIAEVIFAYRWSVGSGVKFKSDYYQVVDESENS